MKAKKLLSWIGGVLGVIILGAIGSGVWSEILSPTLSWFLDIVIRSLGMASVRFKDVIYKEAAQGFHKSIVLMTYPYMVIVVFFAYIWLVEWSISIRKLRPGLTTKIISPTKPPTLRSELLKLHLLSISLLLVFTISWMRTSYASKVSIKSFNSLDIIAPFIEQKEYLSLKSNFLRIKNAEDYEDFHRKMVELSNKHEIELPLFKPL